MSAIPPCSQHVRGVEVGNRPPYRQGRKPTAVKVFTIADESQHVLVFGVPSINLIEQVQTLANQFGPATVEKVDNYPNLEEFTDLYHLHYTRLASARAAKRRMDDKEFYGGILHVCYAPELETVDETRAKIVQRSKQVHAMLRGKGAKRLKGFDEGSASGNV